MKGSRPKGLSSAIAAGGSKRGRKGRAQHQALGGETSLFSKAVKKKAPRGWGALNGKRRSYNSLFLPITEGVRKIRSSFFVLRVSSLLNNQPRTGIFISQGIPVVVCCVSVS